MEIIFMTSLIVAMCATGLAYFFFNRYFVWWELVIMIIVSVLFSYIYWVATNSISSRDIEYLTTTKIEARYYEAWDEYIEQTCPRTYECGTPKNPQTCTEYVDCSYVSHHSPYWVIVNNFGQTYHIDKKEYFRLKKKYLNESFVDMHRDYHSEDGDMYRTRWDNNKNTYESITKTNIYENKMMQNDEMLLKKTMKD